MGTAQAEEKGEPTDTKVDVVTTIGFDTSAQEGFAGVEDPHPFTGLEPSTRDDMDAVARAAAKGDDQTIGMFSIERDRARQAGVWFAVGVVLGLAGNLLSLFS